MSKEELLKCLIAEIDLIMHDKDYRFENANGTWYSRESCRDLTNEEVFEELRTELRQVADLEAKLAEYEKFMKDNEWDSVEEMQETLNKCEKKYFDIQQELAGRKKLCDLRYKQLQNSHQDKISFAVEQLEKVKEDIKKGPITDYDLSENFEKMYKLDAIRQIDNQIASLKKEMK